MARLRFAGRPGRRFGNKGLHFASCYKEQDRKTQFLVKVHSGLRDFLAIAGESDEEEDFNGFSEDEIQKVIKKTSELLTLVASSPEKDAAVTSVEEISGRLRQRVQKTTTKPFLQLMKSRSAKSTSFTTSTPRSPSPTKKPTTGRGFKFLSDSLTPETTPKSMKGNIKVRLVGNSFLGKKAEKKAPAAAEVQEPQIKKVIPKVSLVVRSKTVSQRVRETLQRRKELLMARGKVVKKLGSDKARPRLDGKKCEKLKSDEPEASSPKRVRSSIPGSRSIVRKSFRRLKSGTGNVGETESPFRLPSESMHSQRKITANKRFIEEVSTGSERPSKKPRLVAAQSSLKKEHGKKESLELETSEPDNTLPSPPPVVAAVLPVPDVQKKIPIFDAPLICDSKRPRKPAQKLIAKWSEDYDLNKKKSRKSIDSVGSGVEQPSSDETIDSLQNSASRLQVDKPNRFHHKISNRRKKNLVDKNLVEPESLKAEEFSELNDSVEMEAPLSTSLPLLPSTNAVLSQKNDLGKSFERPKVKKIKKIERCCICDGTYRLSHHFRCQGMVCRNCSRFYMSKAKQVLKGSLKLVCDSGGTCTINWKSGESCDACRYRKCLEFFPSPEETANFKSVRKCDIAKRDKHRSSVQHDWNAELVKFLQKPCDSSAADQSFDSTNTADLSASTQQDKTLDVKNRPSRRLCKLGKGRSSMLPKKPDVSVDAAGQTFDASLSTPGHFGVGEPFGNAENKLSGGAEDFGRPDVPVKSNFDESFYATTSETKSSESDSFLKSEIKPVDATAVEFEQRLLSLENSQLQSTPRNAFGQDSSPRVSGRFGGKAEGEGADGAESDASDRKIENKGPRIKHVCRKAAVVLGKPPATFPSRHELCLSALPSQEKERILQQDERSQGSSDLDEANSISKEKSKDVLEPDSPIKKATGKGISRKMVLSKCVKRSGGPKKTLRCKNCIGCLTPECGVCAACKDMPKNGGRGTMKHACIHRVCRNPILPWHKLSPEKLAKAKLEKELESERKETVKVVKKISKSRLQTTSGFSRPRGRPRMSLIGGKKYVPKLGSIMSSSSRVASKLGAMRIQKTSTGAEDKLEKNQLMSKSTDSELQPQHTVKVDFNENIDSEVLWRHGMATVSMSGSCLRAACLICGSLGQKELIYCSVCCEPFHTFCLDEKDRPKDGCDTWCCLQCQFCHVCYGQSKLLQCDKCQESYHPECLGPNYPTNPSRRKKIWVCSKCVKCRSCGATTPGQDKDATWMCDFSLCYNCGLLMEKGNFCPVCRKCYMDDDWESQMIQCSTCHSWVHSKCEELTDEMYQIVTYMPEDVPFNCRVCCPNRPSVWEVLIQQEMLGGMKNILDAIVQCKSSSLLEPIKDTAVMKDTSQELETETRSNQCPAGGKTDCSVHVESCSSLPVTDNSALGLVETSAASTPVPAVKAVSSDAGSAAVASADDVEKTEDAGGLAPRKENENLENQLETAATSSKKDDLEPKKLSGSDVPASNGCVQRDAIATDAVSTQEVSSEASGSVSDGSTTKISTQEVSAETDVSVSDKPVKNNGSIQEASAETDVSVLGEPVKNNVSNDVSTSIGSLQSDALTSDGCVKNVTSSDVSPVIDVLESVDPSPSKESGELAATSEDLTEDRGHCGPSGNEHVKNGDEPNASDIATTQSAETPVTDFNKAMTQRNVVREKGGFLHSRSEGRLRSLLENKPGVERIEEASKNVPHDFQEIRHKLEKENGYATIEEFAADIARIIRYNTELKDDETVAPLRAKAGSTVRLLFMKQVEKYFPWFNVKNSRCWSTTSNNAKNGIVDQAVMPPSEDHTYAHWFEKAVVPLPPQPSLFRNTGKEKVLHFGNGLTEEDEDENGEPVDTRCCAFCWSFGDADEDEAGRLISAGQDDWVHINCALWSAEVYEEMDGTLQMVHSALARSRKLRCDVCGKPGATVGCCQTGCNANFHFVCARRKNCAFLETKKMFCELHWMSVDAELIADGNFEVSRRLYVGMSTNTRWSKRQWQSGLDPASINVLIGSLLVESLGRLSPLSDTKSALLPVDFCVSRTFWSTEDPRQRTVYICRIIEVVPKPKAPEVINDITVVHDENDPRYDMALAMLFTFQPRDPMSDESTLSAYEGPDMDLSDSEIEAMSRDREVSHQIQSRLRRESEQNHNSPIKPVISCGTQVTKSCPSWKTVEDWVGEIPQQQPSLHAAKDKFLPVSTGCSQLSASTLKMLGFRDNALPLESQPEADDGNSELMLVKVAARLNEAAAKNRLLEHQRRFRDLGGFGDVTSLSHGVVQNPGEDEKSEQPLACLPSEPVKDGLQFVKNAGKPDRVVVMKKLVQMDGPAGESDLEDCDGEDLDLVADFSSESDCLVETDRGAVPSELSRSNRRISLADSETGVAEKREGFAVDASNRGDAGDCVVLKDSIVKNALPISTDGAGDGCDVLIQPVDSEIATSSATESKPAASNAFPNIRLVPASPGGFSSSPSTPIVPSSQNVFSRLTHPVAVTQSPARTVTPSPVRYALSQLLNSSQVSYLGSLSVSSSKPTQGVGNIPHNNVPSVDLADPRLSPGPVSVGSLAQQIQLASPSSGITPQVLKSLQQILGSRPSQPVFFTLANHSSAADQSSSPDLTANLSSVNLAASAVNATSNPTSNINSSVWNALSSPSSQLLSQTVGGYGRNMVNTVPLHSGHQVQLGNQLTNNQSGLKHYLENSVSDQPSKRLRTDSYSAVGSSLQNHLPSGSGVDRSATMHTNSFATQQSDLQDRLSGSWPASKASQPRQHSSRGHGSASRILTNTNRDGRDADLNSSGSKTHKQRTSVVCNKKSKSEPTFEPHPMFRPHLPEAEMEEEIENSPLLSMLDSDDQRLKDEAQQRKTDPHLMFEITSSDGFRIQADSLNKAWKAVTDKVQDARLSAGMKPVSFTGMNGLNMTGLNHPAVVYLVEQLPGFKHFQNYKFKYHPPCHDEDDQVIENPHGCARSEPFSGRNKCEMFSFLLSRYRTRPKYDPNAAYEENVNASKSQRRCTSLDLPMAMRFRHLRTFAKEAVGVYRSSIHGRGLFCKRDIDAGEMIIEYSGEVIRAILTDKREKYYESKAMGCYMFRKDRDHVIDSTMMGNAARFINHSCDPNCYSKVILVDNRKHIVILAQRAIKRGEELTYDYKFPIEDVKIPCTCGSRRCRKYLN